SGGTLPYTYLWSTAGTTDSIGGLVAGSYTVTVTDANSCTKSEVVVISTTLPPNINLDSLSNISCFGGNDGSIDISVLNGSSPFIYNWSNGNTTTSNNNLVAGLYTVIVTDSLLCADTAAYLLFEPTVLDVSITSANAICVDGTGSAMAIPTGGTTPYSFLWSNSETTSNISNLSMGIYTVTVTDANGCTETSSVTIDFINSPVASIASVVDVTCFGYLDGAININVVDGSPPYSYFWSNGQTTQNIDSLIADTYTVFVVDTNGCADTLVVLVNEPSEIVATFNVSNANCGVSNGSAVAMLSGGTPGYTYLWSTGSVVDSITNQIAGTYTLTITDTIGCSSIVNVNINNDGAPSVTLDSLKNATCNGAADGLIDVSVTGGLLPYTYNWSNGETTQDLLGVAANSYTLTITDANGCVITTNYTITEPLALVATTVTVDATCGLLNGSAAVVVLGGTPPYTYLWSSGSTTSSTNAQPGGPISVDVIDSNNCKITVFDTIFDAGPPMINLISINNNLCFGESAGIINVFGSVGSPPYLYNWSNGETTEDVSGLTAGIYTLTITDLLGCTDSSSYTITEPTELMLSLNSVTPICNSSNGMLSAVVSGGTSTYSYLWSTSDTTASVDSLSGGTYTVTVTDANSCTKTASTTLIDNGNPVINLDTTFNVKCNGALTGQIFISVAGGTPSYLYTWSNGFTTEDLTGVGADVYTIQVVDSNGCVDSSVFVISEPDELVLALATTPATCDSINGAISATVTGGVTPYSYMWSNSDTTAAIFNQPHGIYTLTVTDSNSCVTQLSDTILDLFTPQITLSLLKNVSCNGGSDGIIDISVLGPSQPFTYLWSRGDTIQDLLNVSVGTYTLTVTDTNNCVSVFTQTVTESDAIGINSIDYHPSCDLNNGAIDVSGTGGSGTYTYLWSNGFTTDSIGNLAEGTYLVTITDALSCDSTFSITLVNTGKPVIFLNSLSNVKCFGGSDGEINISVSGGVPGYTYLWTPTGDTIEDISGLSVGTYTVTVTDSTGCSSDTSHVIGQPSAGISISFNSVPPSCGVSTGSACANIVGGTPGYTYLWSTGESTACINNIAAGSYTVTITDANLCTQTGVVALSDLSGPQIVSIDSSSVTCPGADDGSISLVITAANPPYTILWSNGATNDTITGLSPNTYIVTITDVLGCIATEAIVVDGPGNWDVQDSIPTLNGSFNVSCNGLEDAAIYLEVNGGTAPYSYLWITGAPTKDLINIGAGSYTIFITDDKGCDTSLTYTITQPPPLFGNPMGNVNICGVTTTVLMADDPPPGADGFWVSIDPTVVIDDSSASNTVVSNLQQGNNIFYWIVNDGICFDSAEVIVVASSEINAIAGVDKSVCENTASLTATPPQSGIGYWTLISGSGSFDDSTMSTTMISGLSQGPNEFLWTVVNGDCRDSASVIITLEDPQDCIDPLELPTGITPNNDMRNDYFVIKGIEAFPQNEFLVFNRWGNLVYDQKNYDNSWNGVNNSGDELPDGTYFIIFRSNNGANSVNGYVDIRRR
ncbi:MAG: T9SS type B sorting domain-containing protein, partial [Bacteroidia bacterium]|nr:T9SS type B sorting domain-containing protein [Bacteroidia bacterium]